MLRISQFALAAILLISCIFTGCSGASVSPIATTRPKTTDRPVTSALPTVIDSPVTSIPSSMRLTLSLDYFGIKSTHQPAPDNAAGVVQLLALVEDGNTAKQFSYPSSKTGTIVTDYSLQDLKGQIVFQTPSIGNYVKFSVLAFNCANKDSAQGVLDAFQSYNANLGSVIQFFNSLPQSKQLIGYYEHSWSSADNWGISSNEYQESDHDLFFWFRIWSNKVPLLIAKPKFLPEVKIQNVTLPDVKISQESYIPSDYTTTFRLVNNEPVDLTIDWQAKSSTDGNFDSGSVPVPRNGSVDVTKTYHYTTPGIAKLTYTISYHGVQLDTWSGDLNAKIYPDVKIQNVSLPSNARVNFTSITSFRLVNNEPEDIVVHWQLNSSVFIYDGANVIVPKNGYRDISALYQYKISGKDYITYIISYNGNQIDTWTGTLDIAEQPQ